MYLGHVELDVFTYKIEDKFASIQQEHVFDKKNLDKFVYLRRGEVKDRKPCTHITSALAWLCLAIL